MRCLSRGGTAAGHFCTPGRPYPLTFKASFNLEVMALAVWLDRGVSLEVYLDTVLQETFLLR